MPTATFGHLQTTCQWSNNRLNSPTNLTNNTPTEITLTILRPKRSNHWLESQQPITSRLNWQQQLQQWKQQSDVHVYLYTIKWRFTNHMTLKNDFPSGCRNVNQCQQQQFFSNYTNRDDRTRQTSLFKLTYIQSTTSNYITPLIHLDDFLCECLQYTLENIISCDVLLHANFDIWKILTWLWGLGGKTKNESYIKEPQYDLSCFISLSLGTNIEVERWKLKMASRGKFENENWS